MHIDKQFILEHLREEGQSDKVQHAIDQLPDKIDHEQHAQLLEKLGIDPGALAAKAAKRGLGSI
jgi:hypothetical protein